MKTVSEFGDRLRRLREKKSPKKLPMIEVAEQLGLSRTAYAYYEYGKREPNFETLIKLSDYYGVSLDYLIKGVGDENFSSPDPTYNKAVFAIKDAIKEIEVKASLDMTISYLEKVSKEELASNKKLRRAILKATKKIIDNELSDKN
ncbi:helix-turn-helix transcriptional regulator [Bacillus glycinifermentans]|nr:helix-turn-helix transcriptional regulator [Bacillus glycinifermentans]NUJ17343.1 helix-turn-helix transcriptional regulator [Bacillus glycinifermentans]